LPSVSWSNWLECECSRRRVRELHLFSFQGSRL
jgi:hypothetical protein